MDIRALSALNRELQNGNTEVLPTILTEIVSKTITDVLLITCMVHLKIGESIRVKDAVKDAAYVWLKGYEGEHGENPLDRIDVFFQRLVWFARDETERQLGVK